MPPSLIAEFHLNPIYKLKKGEKQGHLLAEIHREIDILIRREVELKKRIEQSHKELEDFKAFLVDVVQAIKADIDHYIKEKSVKLTTIDKKALSQILLNSKNPVLLQLCKMLNIELVERKKETLQKKIEKNKNKIDWSFLSSNPNAIRLLEQNKENKPIINPMVLMVPKNSEMDSLKKEILFKEKYFEYSNIIG